MEIKTDNPSLSPIPARYDWLEIKEIRPAGRAKATCIKVSHPSSLYLTRGGILTHNTAGATIPRSYIGRDGRIRVLDTVPEPDLNAAILEARRPESMRLDPPDLDRIYAQAPEPVRIEADRIAKEMILRSQIAFDDILNAPGRFQNLLVNATTLDGMPIIEGSQAPMLEFRKMPAFQGNKNRKLRQVIRFFDNAFSDEDAAKITRVFEGFGGGGSYMTSFILHRRNKLKNLKSLTIREFDPARLQKIKYFALRGHQFLDDLRETGLLEVTKRLSKGIDSAGGLGPRLKSAQAIDESIIDIRSKYKSLMDENQGINIAEAIIAAIIDFGNASFATKLAKGKTFEAIAEDAGDARWRHKQLTESKDSPITVEFIGGSSLEPSDAFDKTTLFSADPPYYHTTGYAGAGPYATGDFWNAKGYQAVYEMLKRAKDAGSSIIYDDEAWWLRGDAMGLDKPENTLNDVPQALEIFKKIKELFPEIGIIPVANRLETLAVLNNVGVNERGTTFLQSSKLNADHGYRSELAVRIRQGRDSRGQENTGNKTEGASSTPAGIQDGRGNEGEAESGGRSPAESEAGAMGQGRRGETASTPIADSAPATIPSGPTIPLPEKAGQPIPRSPETMRQLEFMADTMNAAYQRARKEGLASQAGVPQGNVDAETGQPGYIPTGKAVAFALKAVGRDSFREIVKAHPWWSRDDDGSNALVTEFIAREVVRAAQTGENPTQAILEHARKAAEQRDATRRRSGLYSQSALLDTYTQLSRDADSFKFAQVPQGTKDIHEITRIISRGKGRVDERSNGFDVYLNDRDFIRLTQRSNGWTVGSAMTNVTRNRGNHGAMGYQIAGTWAFENGEKIIPSGEITEMNVLRRTSNMISSILRHGGETRHWMPHPDQGVQWTPGNNTENLDALLRREAQIVLDKIPDLEQIYTDGRTIFRRTEKGEQSLPGDSLVSSLAARFGISDGIGEATIRRALLTRSINDDKLRGRIQEGLIRTRSNDTDGSRKQGIDDSPFTTKGILYSQAGIDPAKYARHAELEAKHNAGTITDAEREEAQAIVDEAARNAGYNVRAYHGSPINFAAATNTNSATTEPRTGKPSREEIGDRPAASSFDFTKANDGAHWFTPDEMHASTFGDVAAYDLRFTNPLKITQDDLEVAWDKEHPSGEQDARNLLPRDFVKQFVDQARNQGRDALIISEFADRDAIIEAVLPLDSSQIKSADPFTGVPLEQRFDSTSDSILRSQAPNAFVRIAELEAKALQEVDGKRTIGDPFRAHSMDNEVWMAYDEFRKSVFQAQREDEWKEAAQMMVARDYDGTLQGIIAKGNAGESLTPTQTKAAEMIIAAETGKYVHGGKTAEQRKVLATLIHAVRTTRAETARTLAAFRDPHKTPAQRWMQFVGEALFSPSKKAQRLIDNAPHQAEVDARIKELEARMERVVAFAGGQQTENAALRREIEKLRSTATKEQLIESDIERNKTLIEKRLAEMGITVDDLLTGPIELRLMGSKMIDKWMQGKTPRETQVLGLLQGKRGGNFSEIAVRMGMTVEEVIKINDDMADQIESELTDLVERTGADENTIDLQQTELPGLRANPGKVSREEAIARAKKMRAMFGFFRSNEYDKIQIERPVTSRTPRTTGKKKGKKPNTKVNVLRADEYVPPWIGMVGEGKNIDWMITEARELNRKPWSKAPTGEGATRGEKLDLGEQPWSTAHIVNPNDPAQVLQAARIIEAATRDVTGWDYVNELFIANLLSAPTTFITNTTGFLYGIGRFTAGRAFRAMVNSGKEPMAEQWGEFMPMFEALADHLGLAFQNAIRAYQTETPVTESLRLKTADVFTRFDEQMGIIPGKLGRTIRIPLRILLATDEFAKTLFSYTHAATLAYRMGKAKGIKGDNLRRFVHAQLRDRSSGIWPAAQQEARYVAFQQKLRSFEEIVADGESKLHPSHMLEGGMHMLTSFKNKDLSDASQIMQATQFLLRLTFPFIRTPYRLLEIGLEMTPIGAALKLATASTAKKVPNTERNTYEAAKTKMNRLRREARRLGTKEAIATYKEAIDATATAKKAMDASPNKGWLTAGKDDRAMLEAKAGMVSAALIFGALLRGAEGDDDDEDKIILITGTLPKSNDQAGMRQLRARTHPQQSIGILLPNGKRIWIDYRRLDPLSTLLATSIDGISEAKRKGGEAVPARLISSIYAQLMDKASLQGFSDLSKTLSGDFQQDVATAAIERASTILVPNVVRNLSRNLDPIQRDRALNEGDYLAQAKYSALPIPALAPPAAIDLYGKPVEKKGNFATRAFVPGQPFAQDRVNPLDRTLMAWNQQNPNDPYAPAAVNMRTLFSSYRERYNATPQQLQRFAKLRGEIFSRMVAEQGLTNLRRPTEQQISDIRKANDKARDEARKAVFGQ